MAVWLVRAGKYGEDEKNALDKNMVIIGWQELPDLSGISSNAELRKILEKCYPNMPKKAIITHAAQIWTFIHNIKKDDLVILPLKTMSSIAIGQVTGNYEHINNRHTRTVKWLRTDVSRDEFQQDLLYSFGAFMTVCQIKRNDAEKRIKAVSQGKKDPIIVNESKSEVQTPTDVESFSDLSQYSNDQIRKFIGRKFKGHELTYLVAAVLEAQDYQLHISQPGPDGGVDILAGKGPMGFDSHKLCVQVKSGDEKIGQDILNNLRGSMSRHQADQGLLVSWGGFTPPVKSEIPKEYFNVRMWDADKLISMIFSYYDKLPEEIRAELPFKRIWVLVPDEE